MAVEAQEHGGQLPGPGITVTNNANNISLTGYFTNLTGQTIQRQQAAWMSGLAALGWVSNNIIENAWFMQGWNTGTTNLLGIFGNSGTNVNGVQTNAGILLNGAGTASNAYITFPAIPPQAGPVTLITFYTVQGQYQNGGNVAGLFAYSFAAGELTTSFPSSAVASISYDSVNVNTVAGLADSHYSVPGPSDFYPHCVALMTDRTNLAIWESGNFIGTGPYPPYTTSAAMNAANNVSMTELDFGARPTGGGSYANPCPVLIHGFIAISNYLSAAQVQQIYALAENTVLPWHDIVIGGDSESVAATNGWPQSTVGTNYPFFGNCRYIDTAQGGTWLTTKSNSITARWWQNDATNFQNGLDKIYPALGLYDGGANDLAGNANLPTLEAGLNLLATDVTGVGGKLYFATVKESYTVGHSTNELTRTQFNAFIRSNSASLWTVVDQDQMWFNLIGTNYYSNSTYFDGIVHVTPSGALLETTNWCGAVGSATTAADNYFAGYPVQPLIVTPPSNPVGLTINGTGVTNTGTTMCFCEVLGTSIVFTNFNGNGAGVQTNTTLVNQATATILEAGGKLTSGAGLSGHCFFLPK